MAGCLKFDMLQAADEGYYIRQCLKPGGHVGRHKMKFVSGPYPNSELAYSVLCMMNSGEISPPGMALAFSRGAAGPSPEVITLTDKLTLMPNVDNLIKYVQAVYKENAPMAHALVQAGWDLKSFAIRDKLLKGEITLSEALATK